MRTWTTREGVVIPLEGMTDEHLLNAIRFVSRRIPEWLVVAACRRARPEEPALEAPPADSEDLELVEDPRAAVEARAIESLSSLLVEALRRGLDVAAPGTGVGVARHKDVFDVCEEPPAPPPPRPLELDSGDDADPR